MAKFLITVMPFPGHYFPLMAVAHALHDRGHEVAFYTGAKIRPMLASEGFACFSFQPADLPVHVIIATGDREPETLGFGRLAPNIHVVDWVPLRDLLPETAVLATTGGSGQVMTALQCGVPMVVVPTEWDQPENARRVVAAGAGVRVGPQQCTPQAVREAVQEILQNPSYTVAARQMQAVLARYDGPGRAAALLETLIPTPQQLATTDLTTG